jgi:hypothetical protein
VQEFSSVKQINNKVNGICGLIDFVQTNEMIAIELTHDGNLVDKGFFSFVLVCHEFLVESLNSILNVLGFLRC